MAKQISNQEIASVLEQIAALLEAQGANVHRIRAYRDGASTVRDVEKPLEEIVAAGDRSRLEELPGIGEGLANVIIEFVQDRRSEVLERLKAEVEPVKVLAQVPGIGDDLAGRIVAELDIRTLEELEQAAHDGRLDRVEGFGERRVEQVRTSLAGMLSGAARRHAGRVAAEAERGKSRPSVAQLLDVDAEYRRKAEAGELKTIAPKRFNPQNESWLPILNTNRDEWKFTALYSNTAQAHELNATRDWVVIYYDQGEGEDQATVVTEKDGALQGKRVVRGREVETRQYYQS